jgi:hypothetical protein
MFNPLGMRFEGSNIDKKSASIKGAIDFGGVKLHLRSVLSLFPNAFNANPISQFTPRDSIL